MKKYLKKNSRLLKYVPDWQVMKLTTDRCCLPEDIIEWYDGYKKGKAEKSKTKEELLPIAWHPDRGMDWCVPEDEKRR